MTLLFSLQDVGFAYPHGPAILSRVNFELRPRERVAIIGANGSGKTTLLHLLVGLCKPTAGYLVAFGAARSSEADFREVRARAALLFQDPEDQLFCPTVLEDVAFGPLNLGKTRKQAVGIAERVLLALGLEGYGARITHKLSGGEKRLVSLAAVLAMEPDALLLDEPSNGLDTAAHARLIHHLAALPQALVLVSHDERLIEALATRTLLLRDGELQTLNRSETSDATPDTTESRQQPLPIS
ncbi:MAG: ABC transporter ATP-binding protein [Rhodospirillales bacterium]|nr:ABC transporter ATP-binding protein [Rhodospirillales bacterium]